MVRVRGKRERGIMDPALSMHRPGTVQGKKDIRVHDIPFFSVSTRRDKARTEGYLLPKKFLWPFITFLRLGTRESTIYKMLLKR